jgi:hypothetical protein
LVKDVERAGSGAREMLGWLKRPFGDQKPAAPKTWQEIMLAYRALIEKHPTEIMDVAMLPIPKDRMKMLLKALYAKATTAELQSTIEVCFKLLSLFQEGVGATPINAWVSQNGGLPSQAGIANLENWMAWNKVCTAEADALRDEWKRFVTIGGLHHQDRLDHRAWTISHRAAPD